jgi:vacuolar-type H+-ATPase subunit H
VSDDRHIEPDELDDQPPVVEDAEGYLRQAIDVVTTARTMPLSTSVLVARDDLLAVLQGALERMPDELRRARWLLKERDEFLAARQREADELLDEVRAQAERMVQRTEIVRQANQVAQRIITDARSEARRLRHEAEDYCDQKLASFEIVLERTTKTVQAGREKLQLTPAPSAEEMSGRHLAADGGSDSAGALEGGFFDQDDV